MTSLDGNSKYELVDFIFVKVKRRQVKKLKKNNTLIFDEMYNFNFKKLKESLFLN